MTDKITLATVSELQAFPSAAAAINSNSAIITAAIDNTLSRDGTQPNSMAANLDMNSHRILNLPLPVTNQEPARLADLEVLTGGGTITINPLPTGGTTGQVLEKNSSTNYDASWASLPTIVNTINGAGGAFTTGNGIDSNSSVIELTAARRTLPTRQIFTTGSGTYTTPANCLYLHVRLSAGGGGGGGSGTSGATSGGSGGSTSFSTFSATGGSPGTGGGVSTNAGGTAGTGTGGAINIGGITGQGTISPGITTPNNQGGLGGGSGIGGGIGAGGTGGAINGTNAPASGGGGGGYSEGWINTPTTTYAYSVGAGGTAGTAGTSGNPGSSGGNGIIIIEEFYGT